MEATYIVHWPGKDVAACEIHLDKLRNIASFMGFPVSYTPCAPTTCSNCENEIMKGKHSGETETSPSDRI